MARRGAKARDLGGSAARQVPQGARSQPNVSQEREPQVLEKIQKKKKNDWQMPSGAARLHIVNFNSVME